MSGDNPKDISRPNPFHLLLLHGTGAGEIGAARCKDGKCEEKRDNQMHHRNMQGCIKQDHRNIYQPGKPRESLEDDVSFGQQQ